MDQVFYRLLRHSFANGLSLAISVITGLVLPALIISFVGLRSYGSWSLILAISQFLAIADFGLEFSLARYIADFTARGADQKIGSLVTATLLIYAFAFILLVSAYLLYGKSLIGQLFKLDLSGPGSVTLLLLMFFVALLNLVGGIFAAVLTGLQRMDVASYIGMTGVLLNFIVTVVLLILGLKLWAVAAGLAVSAVFTLFVTYGYLRKLAVRSPMRLLILEWPPAWALMRQLLTLSSSSATNRAVGVLLTSGVRLFLAAYAGLQAVGYYELASRFVAQLARLPLLFATPLIPAVAELAARDAHAEITAVIRSSLKYMSIVSLPVFAFSIIFAEPLVALWIGKGYTPVAQGIAILVVGTYLTLLTSPALHSLVGIGRPKLGVQFGVFNLVLNGLVTTTLIMRFGFLGAVIGQTTALAAVSCYFLVRFHREQMLPLWETYWEGCGRLSMVMVTVSIPILVIYEVVGQMVSWTSGLVMTSMFSLHTGLFVVGLWFAGILDGRELALVKKFVRTLREG